MAFTLNRRLSQLVDSNGQLNTGKIPNDYITSDHVADNTITSAMLHTSFTVAASNLTSIDTDDVSEGSSNLYYTDARVGTYISGNRTYGTISSGNITTTGYLAGPSTFTIDPAAIGDNTGTVVIAGNLQVDGTTTTINSTTLTVDDKLVTLASGSANAGAANGAGIEVDIGTTGVTNPSLLYDGTNDEWDFNRDVNVDGAIGIGTTNPTTKLHITSGAPNIRLEDSDTNSYGEVIYNTASGGLFLRSDENGAIGTTGSNIIFETDGTERMRLASDGQLLINKIGSDVGASVNIVEADGNFRLQGGNRSIKFNNGSHEVLGLAQIASQKMQYASGRMTIDYGNSRVGIGTAAYGVSPTHPLHVHMDVSNDTIDETKGLVKFQSTGGNGMIFGTLASSPFSSYIQSAYVVDTSLAQYNLALNPIGGRVGIGTTSPAGKLHISGNSDVSDEDCMLIIDDEDSDAGSRIPAIMFRSNTSGVVTNQARIRGTGSQGMILSGSSALTDDIVVQSEKIGIGTNSPAVSKGLHINSAGNSELRVTTTQDSNTPTAQIGYSAGSGYFLRLADAANNEDVMIRTYGDTVFNGGRVGIGTSSVNNFKLYVDSSSTGKGLFVDAQDGGYTAIGFSGDGTTAKGSLTTHDGQIYIGSENTAGTGSHGEFRINPATVGLFKILRNNNADSEATAVLQSYTADGYWTDVIRETKMGYGTSYNVTQIGTEGGGRNLSLNYDPSANASGAFSGTGEILIPNNKAMIAPNAANNGFVGVLKINANNSLQLGGANYQTSGHILIDNANGYVTKPNQPHAYVSPGNINGSGVCSHMATNSSYPNQNWSHVIVGGTARLVAPVTGVYHIDFNTITDSGTGRIDASIQVNGGVVAQSLSQASGSAGFRYRNMSITVKLDVGDYIQFANGDWYNSSNTGWDSWRVASVTLVA